MHPALLTVLTDDTLPDSAKKVYAHLYARTNGTLNIDVPLDDLLADLRMAESTLRRNRAILAGAGVLESWYTEEGEVLHCELRSPTARALGDRETPADAHLLRAEPAPEAPRAPTARALGDRDDPVTPVTPAQRAVGARALGARSERDDAQNPPPHPPMELVNTSKQQQVDPSCCSGGGAGEPDPDAAELLGAAGVAPHIVAELADLTFEAAARHVAAWQAARTGRDPVGVGALVKRLRTWAVPENLTADQLQAGLLADRVTPADLAAWGIRRPPDAGYVPAGYEHIIQH